MGWNFFRDVLGTNDPGANDPNDPASSNYKPNNGPDYGHGADGGAVGHWNDDGSWTWDSGNFAGTTIPAAQAQANKDLYDQSVSDSTAAQRAKQDFAKKNTVQGTTDLSGALDHVLVGNVPGRSLDTSQADAQRNNTGSLIALLQQQAATGDGAWQDSFNKAVQGAQGNASALGQDEASQSRSGYAGSLRNIVNAQGAIGQRAVGEADVLRNQSKLSAQEQLAQLLGSTGQGDIEQSVANASAAQGLHQANQALSEEGQKQTMADYQAAAQGASTLASLSKGGRVPGKPKVFGDSSKNDVVPAWLSPKEIVLPLSVVERPDAPQASARFVAAIKAGRGPMAAGRAVQRLADGGQTWQPGQEDPSDSGFNWMGLDTQAPSIRNGGLLDTAQYAQTRGQMDGLAQLLGARARGDNGVADTIAQQQNNTAFAQAVREQNARRVAPANVLQAQATEGSRSAGEAGARRGAEQAAGQRALGTQAEQRRAQEIALAQAQQKAEWTNTMMNMGVNLQNQAAVRNAAASAGQAAAGIASLGGRDSGGYTSPYTAQDTPDAPGEQGTRNYDANLQPMESAPDGGGTPADNYGDPSAQYAAHGGVIGRRFAEAARRMAKGGKAEGVAHLTILIPAPPPAMVVGAGPSFARAAKLAEGGRIVRTGSVDASRTLNKMRDEYNAEQVKAAIEKGPDLNYRASQAIDAVKRGARSAAGTVAGMAEGGVAEPSPFEKLAQAVQAGARIASGYAAGGAVRGYSGEAGYPDDQVVTPDGGASAPVSSPTYTPGPAPDAGVSVIPQASFQPMSSVGLDRTGPTGQAIPWEKSLEHEATTPPAAKLTPMKPPTVAPLVAPKPAAPTHSGAPDALRAPYAPPAPDSFDEGMRAVRAEGELKAQQATELAKTQGAYQEQLQRNALAQAELVKRADADAQSLMGRYNDAVDQMKHIDTTIDPGRFWANANTGQKVAGIIGMVFGVLGSRDGTNKAAEMLGKAIDRDVDAQKAEVEARLKKGEGALSGMQTAYAMNRQLFQSDLAANAATKASLLDLSITQAEQIKTAYAGKLANPEADTLIAQLKQARDKYVQQAQAQVVENNLKRSQTAENYAQAGKLGATGGASLVSPGYAATGAIKLGPEELSKFREGVANQATLGKQADELSNLISSSSQLQVGGNASRAKAIAAQMKSNLKEMEKLGALSKDDYALLDDQLPDPSAIFTLDSTKKAKLDQFTQELENRVAAHANSLGLVPVGRRPATQSHLEE